MPSRRWTNFGSRLGRLCVSKWHFTVGFLKYTPKNHLFLLGLLAGAAIGALVTCACTDTVGSH